MKTIDRILSISGPLQPYIFAVRRWFTVHVASRLPGGWRTPALVNTALMIVVSTLMIIFTMVALIQAGGFNRPLVFFTGSCGVWGATALNTVLHLLINIFSTAMLASSNMFMQILSAPSREEVDKAHANGSWLEIGVLSARNMFRLSRFKILSWLGFLGTSIPIHLLFNSTVVQTSYRFSRYDTAIAAEPFIQQGAYRVPGASLLPSGGFIQSGGFGTYVDLEQYQNKDSEINQKIAATARQGSTWTRITTKACREQYVYCDGLSNFANVIFVVTELPGWTTSRIWNLTEQEIPFYGPSVPDNAQDSEYNSLWFYGECEMSAFSDGGAIHCGNSCNWSQNFTKDSVISFYPEVSFANSAIAQATSPDFGYGYDWEDNNHGYDWEYNNLTIAYCLAQPVHQSCKVTLSTALMVCVTVCAVLKAILCALVYYRLRSQRPLVTPGDAIESFVSTPDSYTIGMCLVSQGETRMTTFCGVPQPGPRKYQQRKRILGVNITSTTWLALLFMMISALAPGITLEFILGIQYQGLSGGFGTSSSNPLTFSGVSLLQGVLIANSPQLALSLIYVTYNNMFTRLLVGKSWAMRSLRHSSLRVTAPKGQQRSTYRLQLPYRYSVPLVISSGMLHWLLSNTIYIVISQGDYFAALLQTDSDSTYSDPSLPPGSTVSVGYSVIAMIILVSIGLIGIIIPIIWSRKRLPGFANSVGCNSFAMSASCHVSKIARPEFELEASPNSSVHGLGDSQEAFELIESQLLTSTDADDDETPSNDSEEGRLEKVAQSKLKWGVVKMPDDWYQTHNESYGNVGHISFGTTEDEVENPQDGHWYA